ncbi:hypothetical protein GQ600_14022 [Phytophthora cactorum]|nr:hypothetical protein GQ600_14022 [Phytophthora cactorum]
MSGLTPNAFANEPTGLQDVLAFIADFEMEDSVNHDSDGWMEDERSTPFSYDCSSSSSNHGPNQTLVANAASMAPRRHRVSRKEELEYLRMKVTEMEEKLKKLKNHAEGGGTPPPPVPATLEDAKAAMQLEQSVALWKKMAQRQKSQREMVESENTKLREKLKTQVRMAKSLQRILRKRERAAEEITAETPKRFKQLPQAAPDVSSFDALVQNLDALYAITNERISLCPVVSGSRPAMRKQDIKYNDFTGMFLEFLQSKIVPFGVDASYNYRIMKAMTLTHHLFLVLQSAKVTENMVMRKFGVEIKQDALIVRESIIDHAELSGTPGQGITFRDVGWLVLKDVTGQVSASGPMTLVQSYATLTPNLDSTWEVGALTDFVLQSREDMENASLTKAETSLSLPTAPATKTVKKTFGRPRVSRKEELEYLRQKVKDMESKLQELKETPDSGSPPPTAPSTLTMAKRQKNQRELVEVENVKLREKLKTQVRMAKSLKRILCKRMRDEDQPHGFIGKSVIRKSDVKYSDAAGMFLEFHDSKLWPFDVQTVNRATWRFLTETGHKFNKYIEEHVEMRDNTMLRKFGVELNHGNSVALLFGRQVTRRYVASNRVVLIRHSVIDEIQLPGAQTSGLTFRESGWIVLSSAPALGTGSATLTQGYSTMTPDIDLNEQWEVGTLTDFVLQSREDVEVGNDKIIENLLLEEAVKQSTSV